MTRRILFVDDEKNVLEGLQRSLRPMRREWEMFFAGSGPNALEFLARQPVEVVVADMRMPGMDGIQLLGEVRRHHPAAVRLFLSGLGQDVIARSALGLAYSALLKPCDTETLRATITRAFAFHSLLAQVRDLTKGATPDTKVPIDLNEMLRRIIEATKAEWQPVAEVVPQLDPALPRLQCVLDDMALTAMNLLVNAAQAVSDGVRKVPGTKGEITLTTCVHGSGSIELRVKDTGPGIPPEMRASIFEPFFSTRDADKGSGQGLAIARALVEEKHGGSLAFETEVGRGTTFTMRLPQTANSASKGSA